LKGIQIGFVNAMKDTRVKTVAKQPFVTGLPAMMSPSLAVPMASSKLETVSTMKLAVVMKDTREHTVTSRPYVTGLPAMILPTRVVPTAHVSRMKYATVIPIGRGNIVIKSGSASEGFSVTLRYVGDRGKAYAQKVGNVNA